MSQPVTETVYLDEPSVFVTNTRAVLGNVTYPMANITSVRINRVEPDPSGVVGIAMLGAIFIVVCRCAGQPELSWVVGVLFAGLAYWVYSKLRPSFVVVLLSAGGETHAYASFDMADCQRVVTALSNAIVSRG
jgi:hypothetical protein